MDNLPASASEQRLIYIGDMVEIETKEFTLRKAVEEMENSNDSLRKAITNELIACTKQKERRDKRLKELAQKKKSLCKVEQPVKPEKPKGFDKYSAMKWRPAYEPTISGILGRFFAAFGLSVAFGALFTIVNFFVDRDYYFSIDANQFVWACGIACGFIVAYLPYTIRCIRYRNYTRARSKYQPYVDACNQYKAVLRQYEDYQTAEQNRLIDECECQRQCREEEQLYQKQLQLYELTKAKNLAMIEANNAQIADLQKKILSIHTQKQDLYSLGIIPPDYREMDCVIMLHQIFRNGLKDNMADAILLYEERVFRREIIRGIDKIYGMLGRLNDSMRAVESRLLEVRQELQMIGSDMSNQLAAIADNQSRILSEMEDASEAQAAYAAAQEQWQREQLAETRASRYAAEAVRRSNEKYEWYMEQHRQGLL